MSKQIIEIVPTTLMPVFANTSVTVRSNVVIIQNAGNILVTLDDGWTLRPGEKISFGSWENAVVIRHTFRVRFTGSSLIPDEADNPVVEIYEMKVANVPALADYVDQP